MILNKTKKKMNKNVSILKNYNVNCIMFYHELEKDQSKEDEE